MGCERPSGQPPAHSAAERSVAATSSTLKVLGEKRLVSGSGSEQCRAPCRCQWVPGFTLENVGSGATAGDAGSAACQLGVPGSPCASGSSNTTREKEQCDAPRGWV